jgi:hypothetical protein
MSDSSNRLFRWITYGPGNAADTRARVPDWIKVQELPPLAAEYHFKEVVITHRDVSEARKPGRVKFNNITLERGVVDEGKPMLRVLAAGDGSVRPGDRHAELRFKDEAGHTAILQGAQVLSIRDAEGGGGQEWSISYETIQR